MKNIFFLILANLCLHSVFAQGNLDSRLSMDENFIRILRFSEKIFNFNVNRAFRLSLDKQKLETEGNKYLSEITGASVQEIEDINTGIKSSYAALLDKYPEIKQLTEVEIKNTFNSATFTYDYQQNPLYSRAAESCEDKCKREGRARIAAYTAGGALGCIGGGVFGAWACGTLMFWLAAEETITCLRDCPKPTPVSQ
jgi:hypothetical protein